MKYSEDEVYALAQEVMEATDVNDHNGALLLVTDFFDMKKYSAIIEDIIDIQDLVGSMPYELLKYRDELSKEIMDIIKRQEGKGVYEIFHSVF